MTSEEVTALYEQAKRVIRASLPPGVLDSNASPFILACHDCGLAFPRQSEVGMIGQHAELAHGWVEGATDLAVDLIFIGEGEPPKGSS